MTDNSPCAISPELLEELIALTRQSELLAAEQAVIIGQLSAALRESCE